MRAQKVGYLCVALLAAATSAQAVESVVEKSSSLSADALWKKVGDFCGIGSWQTSSIARCELSADGKRRTLTLRNGATVVEELISRNDARRTYSYRIVSGPLPVADYTSSIHVAPKKGGPGSTVAWRGKYASKGANDAEAKMVIDGIYESGLQELVGE